MHSGWKIFPSPGLCSLQTCNNNTTTSATFNVKSLKGQYSGNSISKAYWVTWMQILCSEYKPIYET